ncbi:hypothetical protein ACFVWX_22995 [Streptomyces sp. NPDC058220]|uniref:hypothetical protein n=1 Tax=Streptomyces sp. NPDC058220 TaxID=3346387 RepID=UPI0036ED5D9C
MNELVAGPGSSGGEPPVVGQRLHAVLDAEQVVDDLRRYFGIGLPPGAGAFTGAGSSAWRAGVTVGRLRTGSPQRTW